MRMLTIDDARGIGIILIIALHSGFHADWMISFEMPLFYILSGIFFSVKQPFGAFLVKKINNLLIPYLFFEAPKILYDIAIALQQHIPITEAIEISSVATTTWFLLCLFEIQIICWPFVKTINNKTLLWCVAMLFSIVGFAMSEFDVPNFLYLCSATTGAGYFLSGMVFRARIIELCEKPVSRYKCLAYGVIAILTCFIVWSLDKPYIFYRANMLGNNWMTMTLTAVAGFIAILFFSKFVDGLRIDKLRSMLLFYGQNSLIILGIHLYFIIAINRVGIQLPNLVVFVTVTVAISPVILLIKRYFPGLCGVKPLISFPNH